MGVNIENMAIIEQIFVDFAKKIEGSVWSANFLGVMQKSLFEKNGILDKATGNKFLKSILETGGSEPALELFKKFRGREPKPDALLRHSGIKI